MKSLKTWGLIVASAMMLASCGQEASSSNKYPTNDQEVVEKVASLGAIAVNGKNVQLTPGATNTLNDGTSIILATKWSVQAWDGTKPIAVEAKINWTLDSEEGWTKKENNPDSNHVTYVPTQPAYGEEDKEYNLTGVIKYYDGEATLSYKLVVAASTLAPTEITDLGAFFENGKIKTSMMSKFVTIYGYYVGGSGDCVNSYIAAGAYGCQLYKVSSYSDILTPGTLIKATGTMTNYYGLELTNCKLEVSDRTDIAPVNWVELDDTVMSAITGNGTVYDNAPVTATNAEFVSCSATSASGSITVNMKTATGKTFALYVKSGATQAVRDAVFAVVSAAKAGDHFNLKGVQSYYSSSSLIEILGWTADCIVAA